MCIKILEHQVIESPEESESIGLEESQIPIDQMEHNRFEK